MVVRFIPMDSGFHCDRAMQSLNIRTLSLSNMEYKQLGDTNEKLPAIGMGSWKLEMNEESVAALKRGIELGMKFIDTAEIYGTEPLVAKAIKGEEVFVATKVWPSHFRHKDVLNSCRNSMNALGVKSIDLYQLHWPNYNIPIKETMRAMEELQKGGKIRHIGVSNFSIKELEEAQACLKSSKIVSNQVEYSIITRDPEDALLDYCKRNRITLIAYSPLGHGELFKEKNRLLADAMGVIGSKYGKTVGQIALAWLVSKAQTVAIPKAGSIKHVEENFEAGSLKLSSEDLNELDMLSESFQKNPLSIEFWQKNGEEFGRR